MTSPLSFRHVVIGANHRSSAAPFRDRLAQAIGEPSAFLQKLRGEGVGQAMLLSTCARVEIQAIHDEPRDAETVVKGLFAEALGMRVSDVEMQLYAKRDGEALHHMFRVASSLDSPVVGEPQVMGQVKESQRLAKDLDMVGPELDLTLQAAYRAAKRVRSETSVGERPVSMVASALMLARDIHGALDRCAGLLLAGGDMGELIAEQMLAAGLRDLIVISPTQVRAELVAGRLGCHRATIETLSNSLTDADIVVSSIGNGEYVITEELMRKSLDTRRGRPVFLIDAAIPGDIEPGVNELDGAFCFTLDDLERVANSGRSQRDVAAQEADKILDVELKQFSERLAKRDAVPELVALRRHFEDIRGQVLRDAARADGAEATRLLINRLLHDPSTALSAMAVEGSYGSDTARLLLRLFGIDDQSDREEED